MSLIVFVFTVVVITLYTDNLEIRLAVYIMCFALFFSVVSRVTAGLFYATDHFGLMLITGAIGDVVGGGIAIIFLLIGKGLLWVFLGFALGEAVSAVTGGVIFYTNKHFKGLLYKRDHKRFLPPNLLVIDKTILTRLIKKGFYFLLQGIIQLGMFYTDILVLTFFGGVILTGFYQAAYKISFSACLLSAALTFALYPYYASKFVKSPGLLKKDYVKVAFYNLVIAAFMYFILVVFANVIVRYLYGQAFAPAVGIIKILAIATILNSFNQNNSSFLNAIYRENENAALILVSFGINVVLDILLFKYYNINGVAFATVFCTLSYSVLSTLIILRETKKWNNTRKAMPEGY